jgi:hypothetical protein
MRSYGEFDANTAVVAIQLLQFGASMNSVGCDSACRLDIEAFLVHGHCCCEYLLKLSMRVVERLNFCLANMRNKYTKIYFVPMIRRTVATIEEAQIAWLDTVLPRDENEISFDGALYLSKYGSPHKTYPKQRQEVIIRRPYGLCRSSKR